MAAKQQQAATATSSPPPTDPSLLAGSLSLTSGAWSAIKRTGACACCAARLVACRDPAVYACDERALRAQLDARFRSTNAANEGSAAVTSTARERCCPLCLGLLQHEVPIRIAARPRPSSEVHGDHNRSCEQASLPMPPAAGASDTQSQEIAPPPVFAEKTEAPGSTTAMAIDRCERQALDETATAVAAPGNSNGSSTSDTCRNTGYCRSRMAEAIVECITARGYTVTSFGVTAAVPACLAVRNAAFLEAGLGGCDLSPEPSHQQQQSSPDEPEPPAATTPPAAPTRAGQISRQAVVPVKEALKIGLARTLRAHLQTRQEAAAAVAAVAAAVVTVDHQDSDFMVEVTARAPEADAHAATALLGGPAPSHSGAGKPPRGWPAGGGRWAKKRQRREEQRNPGLTVGAVKKGLNEMDDAGRERMRRWVQGLIQERRTGGEIEEVPVASLGGITGAADSSSGGRAAEVVRGGDGVVDAEPKDSTGQAVDGVTPVSGTVVGGDAREGSPAAAPAEAPVVRAAGVPPPSATPSDASIHPTSGGAEALCEVAIRRKSIHFWGRYTKLSRSVPQTPWFKGFYSVQEAVSEPFQAFSGCVEGLLHGAGREDVDVRMLGKGRPFCLELVDSLRSVDEIAARLPSLADAVNTAGGVKNVGGGVAVSRLRVAGPGELPSDVQAVGEGKRKHYRCVVWVSRPVGKEELVKALCEDAPEELVVQQATPIRVLHRRTLLDRPRSIFGMRAEWINEHFFQLELATSAGTYIKEFVHGDLGRTVPSIGSLLDCRADILQLDVTNVEDRWSAAENS
ncbi:unnamed protein product [Ectocarpus sp. CCAP 1310/34]|nr:unnamed protein product [Ectocarpus sp. CCAP 1310/34]